jgi:hypothetical protein
MLDLKCYDAIGFKAPDFQELNHYLDLARLKGHHPSSERGTYAYWPVGSGIEIWAASDKQLAQLSCNPHYLGSSRVEARVLELVDQPTTLEGGLRVYLNAGKEEAPHYPFLFNVPCWDLTRPMLRDLKAKTSGPLMVSFQLTAFAEELECFDDETAYLTAQTLKQQRLREQLGAEEENTPPEPPIHFIPTGLMVEKGEMPQPRADFGGEVIGGDVLNNAITNQKSLHLRVKTLGMTVDVVSDASIVNCRPKLHGFVCGHFWLSGRLIAEIESTNRRLRIA